jgi:hypothetical protein
MASTSPQPLPLLRPLRATASGVSGPLDLGPDGRSAANGPGTIAVWHITWSVNSITHLWGYRTFDTPDDSRNNWLVALLSNGEGWHNNHHAEPRSIAHGQRWWELDVSYLTIRALERVGLASDIVKPSRRESLGQFDKARCRRAG